MGTVFVSASKLKQHRLCPHKQKHEKYVESPATAFGNAVHEGIAAYWRGNDPVPAYVAAALEHKVPADQLDRAKAIFDRVKDNPKIPIDRENIVTIESEDGDVVFYGKKFFQVEIVPGVWGLRGGMDLVQIVMDSGEPVLEIWDWKTGHGEETDDLQLAAYALAAWRKYPGFKRMRCRFYYVERDQVDRSDWDEQTLVGALEFVDGLARKFIADAEWPRTPNKYCSYCTLRASCEPYQKQLQVVPAIDEWAIPGTIENLPAIQRQLEKIEAIYKAAESIHDGLKEKRNRLLLEHGPQTIEGRVWEAKEQAGSYDYDLSKIFAATEQAIGRPPFEVLDFKSGEFDALMVRLGKEKVVDKAVIKALKDLKKEARTVKSTKVRVSPRVAKEVVEDEDAAETTAEFVPDLPAFVPAVQAQIEGRGF